MRHKTAESLPSLTCPLIVNPSNRPEKSEHGKFLPPFPEIDLLNYDGFHFSHLYWVGIKLAEGRIPDLKSGEVKSAIDHEFCHKDLARTPFSRIGNYETAVFYALIHETFEENEEQIPVPLSHKLSRNELEKQWERVVRFKSAAHLIEEVYAVRSSLRQALEQGFIKDTREFRKQRRQYKRAYGESIRGYGAIYNLFDFVARQIGESAANAIIHNALGTANPQDIF
jgi:hypothetical protein